jgi:hypothetical protein
MVLAGVILALAVVTFVIGYGLGRSSRDEGDPLVALFATVRRLVGHVLVRIDPKVVHTPITTGVSLLVASTGLDVTNGTALVLITGAVNGVVGYLIPNAATGAANRWTAPPSSAAAVSPVRLSD